MLTIFQIISVLEISTNDYGEDKNEKLVEKVLNGKCQKYRKRQTESFRLNAYQLGNYFDKTGRCSLYFDL